MKKILAVIFCLTFLVINAHAQKTNNEPVVILCFDDAETTHLTNVALLLKKFHFGATFMVCEMPVRPPADSAYYLSWPQIAQLYKMGFEIGNHTGHHKNMTTMSADDKQREVSYIEDKCKAFGIPKPISFAYPGNRDDSLSQVTLKQMGYKFARTGGSRYFVSGTDPLLAIPSYTMGSTEKLHERTMKALQELKPGQILAFTIHGIPDTVHPDYTTTGDALTEFLQYMQDHHYNVIAMKDLPKYIGNN